MNMVLTAHVDAGQSACPPLMFLCGKLSMQNKDAAKED